MFLGKTKSDSSLEKLTFKKAVGILTTFSFVVIGWIIFRSADIGEAYNYLQGMFTNGNVGLSSISIFAYRYIILLLIIEWYSRNYEHPLKLINSIQYPVIRFAFYILAVLFVLTFAAPSQEFIYFQF